MPLTPKRKTPPKTGAGLVPPPPPMQYGQVIPQAALGPVAAMPAPSIAPPMAPDPAAQAPVPMQPAAPAAGVQPINVNVGQPAQDNNLAALALLGQMRPPSSMLASDENYALLQEATTNALRSATETGLTKGERAQQRVSDIFEGIVFPAMAAFGGPGTSQAGLNLMQTTRQQSLQMKELARQRRQDAAATLKQYIDIAQTVDPNSLKNWQAMVKLALGKQAQDTAAEKVGIDKTQAETAAKVGGAKANLLGEQAITEAETRRPTVSLLTAKAAGEEASTEETKADTELKKLSKTYFGREAEAGIALKKTMEQYYKAKGLEVPKDAESNRAWKAAAAKALTELTPGKKEQGAISVKKTEQQIKKDKIGTAFQTAILKQLDPEAANALELAETAGEEGALPTAPVGGWTKDALLKVPASQRMKIIEQLEAGTK